MKMLDLYCGAGGSAVGYARAGWEVTGVDIDPQPNFPFSFIQKDVDSLSLEFLRSFDAIHASPPCQAYSVALGHRTTQATGEELLDIRPTLREVGKPYLIENVETAPVQGSVVVLCGTLFGLGVLRHRKFELGRFFCLVPPCYHRGTVTSGEYTTVHCGGAGCLRPEYRRYDTHDRAKKAMGVDWPCTVRELGNMVPPAYTEYLGRALLREVRVPGRPTRLQGEQCL
jgi:DNA (cytosine-5)-methyltransferase 1